MREICRKQKQEKDLEYEKKSQLKKNEKRESFGIKVKTLFLLL